MLFLLELLYNIALNKIRLFKPILILRELFIMSDLVFYASSDPEFTPDEQHTLAIGEAANQYAVLGIIENYRRRKTPILVKRIIRI
jgi:hypothetical protein